MEIFTAITLSSGAGFLFSMACFVRTRNMISALYFKFVPGAIAFALLFLLLKQIGFIVAVG